MNDAQLEHVASAMTCENRKQVPCSANRVAVCADDDITGNDSGRRRAARGDDIHISTLGRDV